MSPEQTEGVVSEIGPRADVWALGVIFYKILVGLHPFLPPCSASPAAGGGSGKTMMSKKEEAMMIVNICEMECPALPDTPANASVAEVVYRALQKDQRDRYDDAGDMHAHLQRIFASLEAPVETETAGPAKAAVERQGRRDKATKLDAWLRDACEIDDDDERAEIVDCFVDPEHKVYNTAKVFVLDEEELDAIIASLVASTRKLIKREWRVKRPPS
mmetsp:Transcript_3812/g.9126  ORF Transcript_3812/g.9126 Transcript_3812/m.9126 type:complete len:216 (-) Transcript_3812:437-1084(-)